MNISISPHNRSDHRSIPRPSSGQKLVLHYIIDGHVICEAAHHLSSDVNFLQLPIPVIHELKRKSTR